LWDRQGVLSARGDALYPRRSALCARRDAPSLGDPTLRTIEVYEASDARPTLIATARDADVVCLPPFDVELSLAARWKAPSVPAVVSP